MRWRSTTPGPSSAGETRNRGVVPAHAGTRVVSQTHFRGVDATCRLLENGGSERRKGVRSKPSGPLARLKPPWAALRGPPRSGEGRDPADTVVRPNMRGQVTKGVWPSPGPGIGLRPRRARVVEIETAAEGPATTPAGAAGTDRVGVNMALNRSTQPSLRGKESGTSVASYVRWCLRLMLPAPFVL
jgi:hypothetical protein